MTIEIADVYPMLMLQPAFVPTNPEQFTATWQRFTERWIARDERMDILQRAYNGDWSFVAPDQRVEISRSPNMVQAALDDTVESATMLPTVRVSPSKLTQQRKDHAAMMERLGVSFLDTAGGELFIQSLLHGLAGFGLMSAVVVCDPDGDGCPHLEWRDPRTCYPEPDVTTLGSCRRVFFQRALYLTQLPVKYQLAFYEHCDLRGVDPRYFSDHTVAIVEYFDDERITVAGIYDSRTTPLISGSRRADGGYVSVILDDYVNPIGMCPAIVSHRISLDVTEPRGQFDQVIDVLQAHIRLMALLLDYSDQAVYSEVWVKDPIGEVPLGGGSMIELGPNGQIGRLAPAVSSFSVFQELQTLIDAVHLGGRWPKTRPGEISQSIASGKFVEATVGMMNTVILTYHRTLERFLEQALRVCFAYDRTCGRKRTVSGVLRNQQFVVERDRDDIDMDAKVRCDYGLGLGRDPAQSAVIGIQLMQVGAISMESFLENYPGITDVQLEQVRLDTEQYEKMMHAKMLQGIQAGTIPDSALVDITRARRKGADIEDLFDKYIVKPQEEAMAGMLTSGLTGEQMAPGGPPPTGQPAVPPAPPPEELLAGITGGGAPPSTISRLSIPLGGGGFAGTQAGG